MERPAFETLGRADGTGGAGKDTDVRCHLCQLVPARPAPALLFIVPRTALSQTPASVPACEGGRGRGVGTRDRNNVRLPARAAQLLSPPVRGSETRPGIRVGAVLALGGEGPALSSASCRGTRPLPLVAPS